MLWPPILSVSALFLSNHVLFVILAWRTGSKYYNAHGPQPLLPWRRGQSDARMVIQNSLSLRLRTKQGPIVDEKILLYT